MPVKAIPRPASEGKILEKMAKSETPGIQLLQMEQNSTFRSLGQAIPRPMLAPAKPAKPARQVILVRQVRRACGLVRAGITLEATR